MWKIPSLRDTTLSSSKSAVTPSAFVRRKCNEIGLQHEKISSLNVSSSSKWITPAQSYNRGGRKIKPWHKQRPHRTVVGVCIQKVLGQCLWDFKKLFTKLKAITNKIILIYVRYILKNIKKICISIQVSLFNGSSI